MLTLEKCGDFLVELGMFIDLRKQDRSFMPGVKAAYVKANKTNEGATAKSAMSYTQELQDSKSAVMGLSGSLEISAEIAKVASITGKAKGKWNKDDKKTSITKIFKVGEVTGYEQLSMDKLTKNDIELANSTATHVVSAIFKGHAMFESFTLEDISKDSQMAVSGELQVQVANVPLSGKAEVSADFQKKMKNFKFEAQLKTVGDSNARPVSSVEDFSQSVKSFFDTVAGDNKNSHASVVKFQLTPLTMYSKFKEAMSTAVPKNVSEANNKHFKEILFDTFVLKEAVKAQSIIAKECKDDTCRKLANHLEQEVEDLELTLVQAFNGGNENEFTDQRKKLKMYTVDDIDMIDNGKYKKLMELEDPKVVAERKKAEDKKKESEAGKKAIDDYVHVLTKGSWHEVKRPGTFSNITKLMDDKSIKWPGNLKNEFRKYLDDATWHEVTRAPTLKKLVKLANDYKTKL